MAYGLNRRVLVDEGRSGRVPETGPVEPPRSSWQLLSEACRLEVVERALTGLDGLGKNPPIAL